MVPNGPQYRIIDTGASNHIASMIELLNKEYIVKNTIPKPVYLPNGDTSLVTHTGTSNISNRRTLKNSYHAPQFKYNLLSVFKATKQLQCSTTFFHDFWYFFRILIVER